MEPDPPSTTGALEPVVIDMPQPYAIEVRPVPRSNRADWTARRVAAGAEVAVTAPDFVGVMRQFFATMDDEISRYADDPIATAQALAHMETLLTDLRYVRDRLKDSTATSMKDQHVRRLTVSGVVTVEASSDLPRTNWLDGRLLLRVLEVLDWRVMRNETGEWLEPEQVTDELLPFFKPTWRLTPLREHDIDPDKFSTVPTDEAGKPVRTPTVKIVDNAARSPKRAPA